MSLESIRRASRPVASEDYPVRFVTASTLSPDLIISLFEEIVLTPGEELVTGAMRFIEPGIERIASSGVDRLRAGARFPLAGGS